MRFLHGGIPFGNKDKDFTFLFMRKQSRFFLLISLATLIYLLMPAYTPRCWAQELRVLSIKSCLTVSSLEGIESLEKFLCFIDAFVVVDGILTVQTKQEGGRPWL